MGALLVAFAVGLLALCAAAYVTTIARLAAEDTWPALAGMRGVTMAASSVVVGASAAAAAFAVLT